MKIAYIGQKGIPAKVGGVEKHAEELASRMAERGHEVFAYVRNNYTSRNIGKYKGVNLIHLPSLPTKHLDAISHTFFAVVHALFQGYDVIHFHSIGPSSLAFLIKIFKKRTVLISTYHCQDYFHKKWGSLAQVYLKFGERMTCLIPDKTITVSRILKKFIEDKFRRKAVYIPNGVSIKPSYRKEVLEKFGLKEKDYILSVSRLVKHKGVHNIIKAFQNLQKKGLTNGRKLVIVGDTHYTEDYFTFLKRLSAGNPEIIFAGAQTGEVLNQLFANAHFFVHASETEGLSIALLEALAYGIPVLSSNIPENLEVVENTDSHIFQVNDVSDLEKKMEEIIGKQSEIHVRESFLEKYNWEKISDQTEGLYKKLLISKS